jgi:hypothetical protein
LLGGSEKRIEQALQLPEFVCRPLCHWRQSRITPDAASLLGVVHTPLGFNPIGTTAVHKARGINVFLEEYPLTSLVGEGSEVLTPVVADQFLEEIYLDPDPRMARIAVDIKGFGLRHGLSPLLGGSEIGREHLRESLIEAAAVVVVSLGHGPVESLAEASLIATLHGVQVSPELGLSLEEILLPLFKHGIEHVAPLLGGVRHSPRPVLG